MITYMFKNDFLNTCKLFLRYEVLFEFKTEIIIIIQFWKLLYLKSKNEMVVK